MNKKIDPCSALFIVIKATPIYLIINIFILEVVKRKMYNKGVANHMKFRTKYWQERQQKNVLPLDNAVITGTTIHRKPKNYKQTNP